MSTFIHQCVESARAGTNPTIICCVLSGWAALANRQYLHGYSILLPDPVVTSMIDLNRPKRSEYLCDMVMIGDVLMEVTGAYRINYAIIGNEDPALHAHIVPRFMSEPEKIRQGGPWTYSKEIIESTMFNLERDKDLMFTLPSAIQKHL